MNCAAFGSTLSTSGLLLPENFSTVFFGAGLAFTLVYVFTLTAILACHFGEVE